MPIKNEVCIVRGVFVSKGLMGIGGLKYKLVSEIKVGEQVVDSRETRSFIYNTPEAYKVLNNLVGEISADGWALVGKEKGLVELCSDHEPQVMTFTRTIPSDSGNVSDHLRALHLLHSGGFVTDAEFLDISKRIKSSQVIPPMASK